MSVLPKLLFFLATAFFYDRSFVPPVPPARPEEQKRTDSETNGQFTIGWYERLMALPILQIWIRLSWLIPSPNRIRYSRSHSYSALIIGGATIRFRCYRELGRHFTFALSIRDNHALVTTGPYSVVRHPSYTGGNMTLLGAMLTLMCDGSWWFAEGSTTPWGKFLAVNLSVCTLLYVPAYLRGSREDAYLKKFFGKEWERFAERVPCRYIPGLF
ncbi:hypothetical protein C8R44DRAFT_865740 [Mycena epipterygia]|nr:hypothetical protein C8R44DRAFT_865740 [Mycena epipterygia]